MAKNPETVITDNLRELLKSFGAHTIKISDSYTRGIPDLLVSGPSGIRMIEIKVDRLKTDKKERSYKSLGLSGAQDHHIRAMVRQHSFAACVVTNTKDGGKLRLWAPIKAEREGPGFDSYLRVASGAEEVGRWLGLKPRT